MQIVATLVAALLVVGSISGVRAQVADPAARDWRSIASPQDRARIEGWETQFDEFVARAEALEDRKFYNFERTALRALKSSASQTTIQQRWAGQWRCRTIYIDPKLHVIAYQWFVCRIWQRDAEWHIEKRTGSVFFDYRVFEGGPTGIAVLGTYWNQFGPPGPYNPQGPNAAGIVMQAAPRTLRVFSPSTGLYNVIEIDLTARVR